MDRILGRSIASHLVRITTWFHTGGPAGPLRQARDDLLVFTLGEEPMGPRANVPAGCDGHDHLADRLLIGGVDDEQGIESGAEHAIKGLHLSPQGLHRPLGGLDPTGAVLDVVYPLIRKAE